MGLKVARGAPAISHLLYADDSLFYCKQSDAELNKLTEILQEYSLASGQQINYQKSSIYFGKNIPLERREIIKLKLGMEQEGGDGIYLGLPESFGGSKVRILSFLKQRLEEKVGGWQNQFLISRRERGTTESSSACITNIHHVMLPHSKDHM